MVWHVFFQAEDGIRHLVRSRGLGDVYKRQMLLTGAALAVGLLLADNIAGWLIARLDRQPARGLSLIHI